jgi:hypothetical protein
VGDPASDAFGGPQPFNDGGLQESIL